VGATSAPQTLEFTNRGPDNAFNLTLTGTHAGDFTIIHDGCAVSELASGDDCEVTVAFKPTAAIPSARLATLTFAREGGGNVLVPLTGTATAPVITPPVTPPVPLCRGDAATVTGSGTITGTPGSDVIVGSLGPDTISGGGGDDTICPLDGDDSVNGGGGEDVVRAGAGNDSLRGGRGKDRLAGRAGDDSLKGGSGADRCDGGAGTDTAKACEKLFSIP
jgi:hypothetical protein